MIIGIRDEAVSGDAPPGSGWRAPSQPTADPQWEPRHERRAAAQVLAVLTVEGGRVAPRFRGSRVALGTAGVAALAAPAHRLPGTGEAEAMTEDATAQHHPTAYVPGGGAGRRIDHHARPRSGSRLGRPGEGR